MSATDGTERRKHVRHPVMLRCRVEGASPETLMWLTDLSEGGCYISTRETLSAGSDITVYCDLGASVATLLTGRVVHVQPQRGFAVEFSEMSQAAQQQLQRFLQKIG